MATDNPTTRANYEPNSWSGAEGGPREDPQRGFESVPAALSGEKRRLRPESFSDHYSQARQFYASQTALEQQHIADAFVFELSKCGRPDIRERMVAGLRNVDDELAHTVSDGLGLSRLPTRAKPAREAREDLSPSPALSILENGPSSFSGRKLGVLVGDGADAKLLKALDRAASDQGVTVELIAPRIGGVTLSDRSTRAADQLIDGAPSVLYDAVVILASEKSARALAELPAALEFVTDAYRHCKFIGHAEGAMALFEAAGLAGQFDDGCPALGDPADATELLERCGKLRYWDRARRS